MNPKIAFSSSLEASIKDTVGIDHLQGKEAHLSNEKQPMTLQEVISKMHWIQVIKKKAS
ncbi:MAG: hypothetical protein ACOVQJ_09315 [Bacteroidia bacterium]